jgi:hypothetical protein
MRPHHAVSLRPHCVYDAEPTCLSLQPSYPRHESQNKFGGGGHLPSSTIIRTHHFGPVLLSDLLRTLKLIRVKPMDPKYKDLTCKTPHMIAYSTPASTTVLRILDPGKLSGITMLGPFLDGGFVIGFE